MSRPSWVTATTYLGTVVVGGTTVVISGLWLNELAQLVGIEWPSSISLPIAVDAGGAVATVLWVTHTGAVEKWAKGVALGALSYSLLGNAVAHLIRLGILPVSWPLVVAVSAVYPLMCWLMVHLLVLARSGVKKPRAKAAAAAPPVKKVEQPKPQPVTEALSTPAVPLRVVPEQQPTKKDLGRKRFFELVAEGRTPGEITAAEIDRHIGAKGYAKQLIADWRAEATTATTPSSNARRAP